MRTLAEIDAIMQNVYLSHRRWCYAFACACSGCSRFSGVTQEEFYLWKGWKSDTEESGSFIHSIHLESKGMLNDDTYLAKIKKGDRVTIQYRDEFHHCEVDSVSPSGKVTLNDFEISPAPASPATSSPPYPSP